MIVCIFGVDFQLYIADIIVLGAVQCGVKLNYCVEMDSVSYAKEALSLDKLIQISNPRDRYACICSLRGAAKTSTV